MSKYITSLLSFISTRRPSPVVSTEIQKLQINCNFLQFKFAFEMSKLLCLIALTAVLSLTVEVDGESLIFGGQNAVNGQFSHHVKIRFTEFNTAHCGGSIIGDRFVLTTALCVPEDYPTKHLRVIVGDVDRVNGVRHQVDKVIIHPKANFHLNNIAVVRVALPFQFTANVRAITLPTKDTPVTNDGSAVPASIVGWGVFKVSQSL